MKRGYGELLFGVFWLLVAGYCFFVSFERTNEIEGLSVDVAAFLELHRGESEAHDVAYQQARQLEHTASGTGPTLVAVIALIGALASFSRFFRSQPGQALAARFGAAWTWRP